MADIFSVIADATRRDILRILLDRRLLGEGSALGCSVSEIVTQLELSQPTVSKHLKVLRDAGLVTVREQGQHRYYSLDYSPFEQVEDWLIPFLNADSHVSQPEGLTTEQASAGALTEDVAATAMALGRAFAETRHQVKSVAHDISSGVADSATKVATVFRRRP